MEWHQLPRLQQGSIQLQCCSEGIAVVHAERDIIFTLHSHNEA